MPADLHCHSVISDGSATFGDILKTADRIGLNAVSITDHDDLSLYNNKNQAYFSNFSANVIEGVEISSFNPKNGRKVHILCYLPKEPEILEPMLKETRERRRTALKKSIDIISRHYPITFSDIENMRTPNEGYFKQHIMQYLMNLGYCTSVFSELFTKLFDTQNGIAPIKIKYPDVYCVLKMVAKCGGVAAMAHPAVYGSFDILEELCRENLLDAIEVDHPRQNPEQRNHLRKTAEKYGLIITGGTDFHGYNTKESLPLGTCTTIDRQLERLFKLSKSK